MVVAGVGAANAAWAGPHDLPTGVGTPFGGTVPVHIAHVGRIDRDLEPPGSAGLRRVTCVGAAGSACFVAVPPARTSSGSTR